MYITCISPHSSTLRAERIKQGAATQTHTLIRPVRIATLALARLQHCLPTQATQLPLEPRHVAEYAAFDGAPSKNPFDGPIQRQLVYHELDARGGRRGPRLRPSYEEEVLALDQEDRQAFLSEQQDDIDRVIGNLERAGTEEWDWHTGKVARPSEMRESRARLEEVEVKKSWSDKIIISQDMQVCGVCLAVHA